MSEVSFGDVRRGIIGATRLAEQQGSYAASIQCGKGATDTLWHILREKYFWMPERNIDPITLFGVPVREAPWVPNDKMVVVSAKGVPLAIVTLPTTPTGGE